MVMTLSRRLATRAASRFMQQRAVAAPLARANHTHAPLTMLTEDEEMFKDTGTSCAAWSCWATWCTDE
jgi:hypothetical protein